MRTVAGVLLCLGSMGVTVGCPSVEKDPPVDVSAATIARFTPDAAQPCNSVLPFPSDLSKNQETGLLAIPICPDDDPTAVATKQGLSTLNGYSVNPIMTADFSGPIDESTIAEAVLVLNAATGAPVAVNTMFVASKNQLVIMPQAPLDEETMYIVSISTALKDAEGSDMVSDQAFTFLKSEEPLIDERGYSRYAAFDDATANGLEPLRQAWLGIFAALEGANLTRDDILVTWFFTTQTVHNSYPILAAMVANGATATHENTIAGPDHPLLSAFGIPTANICKVHTGRVNLTSLITDTGTFGLTATGTPFTKTEAADYILFTPNPDPDGAGGAVNSGDCTGSNPEITWTAAAPRNVAVFGHTLAKCKNVAVAVANSFGAANWGVLALDGPRAGARSVSTLGDQDLDTCPDQPAIPELISIDGGTPNPFAIRDQMRQWGLELVQVIQLAETDVREFTGEDTTGTAPTANIALVGHSWGGMAATLAGSVSPHVDVMAINSASGGLGAIFMPLLQGGIAAQLIAAGMTPGSDEFNATLQAELTYTTSIYRWAMEPADPLYAAMAFPVAAELPVLAQVTRASSTGAMQEANLHAYSTQTSLTGVFQTLGNATVAESTFVMECDTDTLICDDPTGVTGGLLAICESEDSSYAATMMTVGMQTQMVTFIATSQAGTPTLVPATTGLTCTP